MQESMIHFAGTALKQIHDRQYDAEMKSKGVKTIYRFGVAFSGKKVAVETD